MSEKHPNSGPQKKIQKENRMIAEELVKARFHMEEMFDAGVMVFTKQVEGETKLVHTKFGNDFAIRGMMDTFMENHMEPNLEDQDNEGEQWKENA